MKPHALLTLVLVVAAIALFGRLAATRDTRLAAEPPFVPASPGAPSQATASPSLSPTPNAPDTPSDSPSTPPSPAPTTSVPAGMGLVYGDVVITTIPRLSPMDDARPSWGEFEVYTVQPGRRVKERRTLLKQVITDQHGHFELVLRPGRYFFRMASALDEVDEFHVDVKPGSTQQCQLSGTCVQGG